MTTVCVIAAVCILIAGLFAVIVERTNERDEARAEVEALNDEAMELHLLLTEAQGIAADALTEAEHWAEPLRLVDDLPHADDDWPVAWRTVHPIHDQLAHETFRKQIDNWGSDDPA